ncbi:MAG: hypothetical protein A2V69_02240 [Candidatus Portnoybacteria bacterium RBG_13_40_8]|uniref:Uncharacterized protein n=1 Tax=Candidatus Portnoybacteria bacterium RBG_13_40_8 TaxID=1801990 RepID=A0A1G2F336_9BACT|nr:MAG: hypothetical protein A2V69_02240 [Candidatus Portnoybacteria bacterium RBG_13_40_8]OGZ35050.1 MAG: hypothetical protein A2V60_01405 [Candidatus Portnoybacteria bacterium RIFCSPHIGHO2_01_FULL_39_19]
MKTFLVGILCLFFLVVGIMIGVRGTEARFEKELESRDVYPTGSFTLTFLGNEDAIDLAGKEASTAVVEQFVTDLAEASAEYRIDGDINHIIRLGARLGGDRDYELRLRDSLSPPSPSKKD